MTDPNVPSETPVPPAATPPAAATPPVAPPAATPPVAPPAATPPASPYTAAAVGPKQGLSLTSFITGLGGLVFSWVPVFGFLVALAAVITGFIAKKKELAAPKWMWLVGIITGFVGILLSFVFVLALIIPLLIFGSAVSTYNY